MAKSRWRPTATVLAATAVLALGAAAAAYAALSKGTPKPHLLLTTVAQTPPLSAPSTSTTTTPPPSLGATKLPSSHALVKPPRIPLTAVMPKTSSTSGAPATEGGSAITPKTTTTPPSSTHHGKNPAASGEPASHETGGGETGESHPEALLLDTNAASTYNPNGLPSNYFGDPSLAIDGDPSTAWTAEVNPATAPQMTAGLLLDLKSPSKVKGAELVTSTPGMRVQFFGANASTAEPNPTGTGTTPIGAAGTGTTPTATTTTTTGTTTTPTPAATPGPPSSIADPRWTKLTSVLLVKSRRLHVSLNEGGSEFRYVLLWVGKAPAAAIHTHGGAPGHVSINELELFPG